ncbi:hypothetical protein L226DRAFT_483228 [Lentinus tigrinus ALCF2SS1-7]|uniref:uncharacterized protein n=1 Tax=Lentinus tigrinus ALCF2SS1-7 TaxID=1328758 RepID=UPI001165D1BF|nr:hypothetical protein L226DRAFT_483228 [Lentinus tigrinus ALCF2SS1-7]
MPGPRNKNKKKQNKKDKKSPATSTPSDSALDVPEPAPQAVPPAPEPTDIASETSATPFPLPLHEPEEHVEEACPYPVPTQDVVESPVYPQYLPYPPGEDSSTPPSLLTTPFIYDPGDGPRVKHARAFLSSRFAAPPSVDDPLCAEFADEALAEMLCSVLPEETALILWYNKSRRTSRICPACQRLYRLGDVLPEHLSNGDAEEQKAQNASPFLAKEQELSGLCSPVCFILASYNYPGAIRSTWGRMAEELDDATWDLLDGPGQSAPVDDMGLGMLVKMTRCHDLGLGQLFFPDLDLDSDATCNESDENEQEGRPREKTKVDDYEDATVEMRPKDDVVVQMEQLSLEAAVQ